MMLLSEEKKSLKNMGLNGWCLFCLNLSCISPLLCLLKTKKKILCMTCLAVIMMSICEMCIKSKNEKKKKRKEKRNP